LSVHASWDPQARHKGCELYDADFVAVAVKRLNAGYLRPHRWIPLAKSHICLRENKGIQATRGGVASSEKLIQEILAACGIDAALQEFYTKVLVRSAGTLAQLGKEERYYVEVRHSTN